MIDVTRGADNDVLSCKLALEANGARWLSRSSKPVARRESGEAGFDSQALPPQHSVERAILAQPEPLLARFAEVSRRFRLRNHECGAESEGHDSRSSVWPPSFRNRSLCADLGEARQRNPLRLPATASRRRTVSSSTCGRAVVQHDCRSLTIQRQSACRPTRRIFRHPQCPSTFDCSPDSVPSASTSPTVMFGRVARSGSARATARRRRWTPRNSPGSTGPGRLWSTALTSTSTLRNRVRCRTISPASCNLPSWWQNCSGVHTVRDDCSTCPAPSLRPRSCRLTSAPVLTPPCNVAHPQPGRAVTVSVEAVPVLHLRAVVLRERDVVIGTAGRTPPAPGCSRPVTC